jgi:3-deoxy-manno-octulosonate cytidylyltransferase (CMP-KDO synthetase)
MNLGGKSLLENWLIVIPARMHSTRLPRKPLADLAGKPLIVRVWENIKNSNLGKARIVVATDHIDILKVCQTYKIEAAMTSENHKSGSDRVYEVAESLNYPFILNIQGDEPFVNVDDLLSLMNNFVAHDGVDMGTMGHFSQNFDDYQKPQVVKIVQNQQQQALYFSRAPIPNYSREGFAGFYHHQGIYTYRKEALQKYCGSPASELEKAEHLEQLRALEIGLRIYVENSDNPSFGIDTPDDLEVAHEHYR